MLFLSERLFLTKVTSAALVCTFSLLANACEDQDEDGAPPIENRNVSFNVTPTNLTISESGITEKFTVHLKAKPIANVTVRATPNSSAPLTLDRSEITLTPLNYAQGATFTVGVVNSNAITGNFEHAITISLESSDAVYATLPAQFVTITINTDGSDDSPVICKDQCKDDETLVTCPNGASEKGVETICENGCENGRCKAKDNECEQNQCKDASTLLECDKDTKRYTEKACIYGCAGGACQSAPIPSEGTRIRFMAANITSGKNQDYNDHKGIRIIQAFKPDIILMQEFNYASGARKLVDEVCGTDCSYATTKHSIPNAIVSRYPIIEHGAWQSNVSGSRNWDWAVIDIPGDRDLLAVSLHLHSSKNPKEISPLKQKIEEKQKEGNYYIVIGGDFNTKSRGGVRSTFGSLLSVGKDNPNAHAHDGIDKVCDGGEFPVDQNGNSCTSGERDDPYDWVLFDKTLNGYEIPIQVGEHEYLHGHIVDSRVYNELGELGDIPPVEASDSDLCEGDPWCDNNKGTRTNMQHQAVIRDILLPK